jgi:hypothetical protein
LHRGRFFSGDEIMGWLPFSQSRRSWGLLLLGAWLILTCLQAFVSIPVVLIILDR